MLYLFGQCVAADKPYETIIGITAGNEAETAAKLRELVGEKAVAFELYDIVDNGGAAE